MAEQQSTVLGATKRRLSWLMNSPKSANVNRVADDRVPLLEPEPAAKRQRTVAVEEVARAEEEPLTAPAFFLAEYAAEYSQKTLADIEADFLEKNHYLSRAKIADLPFDAIKDKYIVLQLVESRGKCIFQNENRWRLLARQICADGTRGSKVYLQITSYLPQMSEEVPKEWNVRTSWTDLRIAPILVVNGFAKQKDKFINPEWKASLLCEASMTPRIFCGILKKPMEKLFTLGSAERSNGNPDSPYFPQFPFAASLMAQNVPLNNAATSDGWVQPDFVCDYALPQTSGYTCLRDLGGNILFNIIAVIKHYQDVKLVNGGRNFMMMVTVVDPSLNVATNEKLSCYLFAGSRTNLPVFLTVGDIVIINRLSISYHNMQKQGRGRENDAYTFTVIDSSNHCNIWTTSKTPLREVDRAIINQLKTWYDSYAAVAIAEADARYLVPPLSNRSPSAVEKPNAVPESSNQLIEKPPANTEQSNIQKSPQQAKATPPANGTEQRTGSDVAAAIAETVKDFSTDVLNGEPSEEAARNGEAWKPTVKPATRVVEVPTSLYGTAIRTLNNVAARISGEPSISDQKQPRDGNDFCRLS
ncbi:hypothetical protein RvY_10452 [Ramazzottius varieornatus]|uniref:Telomeric single stranded DNA binding POT1/Cdc13 domain-containing protein n=1 Tax=Ramazzottius varieornatus TaxID=947166 RepID=A0A1D1VLT8_RAMVA|nr:hypothetical protein RvY_10452 [Ramazzottius varieornatus]